MFSRELDGSGRWRLTINKNLALHCSQIEPVLSLVSMYSAELTLQIKQVYFFTLNKLIILITKLIIAMHSPKDKLTHAIKIKVPHKKTD